MSTVTFIDSRVSDYESLLASFAPGAQVVILNADQDGLAQISAALSGLSDLDSIQIISHGAQGVLYLGSSVIRGENIASYQTDLAAIGSSLGAAGDILLYGCDIGAGQAGQALIDKLAALTGADVAASNDATGSAALGGDWALEASSGTVESASIAPENYASLLAPPVLTPAGALDTSFDLDGKLVMPFGMGNDAFYSLALQNDGKIVAGGSIGDGFGLVRYMQDGSLDASFDADGVVVTDFGWLGGGISAIAIQADGKIVALGNTSRFTINGVDSDTSLARYNADGSLDASFSGGGKITYFSDQDHTVSTSLALQADGKILAAGYRFNGVNFDFVLQRFKSDGFLDNSFDYANSVTTDFNAGNDYGRSVALQADGRIVVAGSSFNGANGDFALARYMQNGSLDSSFGFNGKLSLNFGAGDDGIQGMAVQADGKILVAGYAHNGANFDFALARYNLDGSLDMSFDLDGKLSLAIGAGDDLANSVTLQADGKFVVAGSSFNGVNNDFALARFNPDGSLDLSFDGDGVLILPMGASDDMAHAVKVQVNGAIVVAGYASPGFPSGAQPGMAVAVVQGGAIPDLSAIKNAAFSFSFNANTFTDPDGGDLTYMTSALPAWLSFNPATRTFSGTPVAADLGSVVNVTVNAYDNEWLSASDSFSITVGDNHAPVLLDSGFDLDGRLTTPIGASADDLLAIAIDSLGAIVAVGSSFNGIKGEFAIARTSANGSADATFSGDGKVSLSVGQGSDAFSGVVLQSDGKILAAGTSSNAYGDFCLVRFHSDGSLDNSFDGDGIVTTAFGSSADDDAVGALALQANGKIVLAGSSYSYASGTATFALARYNSDGSLDLSFDGDGKVTTAIGASYDRINSMALQADGKIVVAGDSFNGSDWDFALARYNTDGSLDASFDGDGKKTLNIGTGFERFTSVALQADGKIVAAGSSWNGANYDFALARINADGSLDASFDGDGMLTMSLGLGDDFIGSMALQADGKIVVVGASVSGMSSTGFAVARFNADGSLDSTFGGDGTMRIPVAGGSATSVKLLGNGQILVGGTATGADGTRDFALVRIGIADLSVSQGMLLEHSVAGFDPEGGQVIYSAMLSDGSALPPWLSFGGVGGLLTGYASPAGIGRYEIKVSATDMWGATSSDEFSLAITNTIGSAGNDTLYGGLGADVMAGLGGNDLYLVDDVGDYVQEQLSAGTDSVNSAVSHTLGDNVENLSLMGNASLNGSGNAMNNVLSGNGGANSLDGGLGADTLIGQGGNDSYTVDNAADSVVEGLDEGIDSVNAWVSHALGANLENLVLMGNANINGTGNALGNVLTGNGGNNVLDGALGADTLIGQGGNDAYTVDNTDDSVVEGLGAGTDSVSAWINYTLGANLENLVLLGSANLSGVGNGLNNSITGNAGNNVLQGGLGDDSLDGGLGADTLIGQGGNDAYTVDNAADSVIEVLGEGTDSVSATVSHALAANVENLNLLGSANINGTGNGGNNILTGNSGNNSLDGALGEDLLQGGLGNDSLNGGAGIDTVSYQSAGAGVTVNLALTTAQNTVAAGTDTLLNFEDLVGSAFADLLTGSGAANVLDGAAGADTINGGNGADTLIGGSGKDSLTGGAGADYFDFNLESDSGITSATWDIVADFKTQQGDKLDLSTLDANSAAAGDQAFISLVTSKNAFSASSSFTAAGQLYFDTTAKLLYGNTDADAAAEFVIQLVGVSTLALTDFIA